MEGWVPDGVALPPKDEDKEDRDHVKMVTNALLAAA
jgi:hypothetical protein